MRLREMQVLRFEVNRHYVNYCVINWEQISLRYV